MEMLSLVSFMLVYLWATQFTFSGTYFTDINWNDIVVTRLGKTVTLDCVTTRAKPGTVELNWLMKSIAKDKWKLVLSANNKKEFSGEASKASMRLTDGNFQDTGVFSLAFVPKMEDGGLYRCLIKQQERTLYEMTILLAVLKVTIEPPIPAPHDSILRLVADVSPRFAFTRITWTAPGGEPMRAEYINNVGTVTKLPWVQTSDNGAYVCVVHPRVNSSTVPLAFNVNVTVNAAKMASFMHITEGPQISTATLAHNTIPLTCPSIQGDYVLLYWKPYTKKLMKLVYQYDCWRDSSTVIKKELRLAGPPYNPQAGNFSFLLTPGIKDGGLYICEVFRNDVVFNQSTLLSVLNVKVNHYSSMMDLLCQYSEWSHVQLAMWSHQNQSHSQPGLSTTLGLIIARIPLPITPDTAGNYTCTLKLKNGHTVFDVYTVMLPPIEVATPSLHPSLSALLLLVPLVAAAVGVLLWRQRHISRSSVEQSLSHYSGETENIYENPDIRQCPPQASVYMDLKPRGADEVYKELTGFEQCQG